MGNCTTGKGWTLHVGDSLAVLRTMPDESVNCCVTSPPYYGLRCYGVDGQIGLETTPEEYVTRLVDVFREVRRVLRSDGVCWLNLGDSMRSKQLIGIPWRVAFALQADGWKLRQDCIWQKPNPMPSSVRDRCTTAHEYMFLLSKSARYWWDAGAMAEESQTAGKPLGFTTVQADAIGRKPTGNQKPENYLKPRKSTRNRRSVWTISTRPYKGAHFATFPPKLVEPCILAGCPEQCCATCGAGWARVVERPTMPKVEASDLDRFGNGTAGVHRKVGQKYQDWRDANPDRTVGWKPSCTCGSNDATPGIVLDPFAGSGTTLAVAIQHGRQAIGIELNPKYAAECAVPRIMATEAR